MVLRRLARLGEELGKPELALSTEDTYLIGGRASLDSIALVTLIADLEGDIQGEFGQFVTLADERAMSRERSPFLRVGTLVDYIGERLAAG